MDEARETELAELLDEVRRIEVLSRRVVTEVMAGGYTSAFRGAGLEFDAVREYVDGDDPRKVDWNVTARMGRPFVKKFVEEREQTVLFLLDLSSSMHGGFGHWSSRQMAARVCACLAFAAIRNNDKVGLIAFSDAVDKFVPPKKGAGHVLRIVRDCLALPGRTEAADMVTDMAPALEFAANAVPRHAIVFLVSDFLSRGWQKTLTLCARRHDLIAVRLLPSELAPPGAGLMRVRDPETGDETIVDWKNEKLRSEYARRVDVWDRDTRERLRRANVDRMDVPVPRVRDKDMVAGPILRFFRMRESRGARR